MECVARFSSKGLCETSISHFPWGLSAGELFYPPSRGLRVPSLSAYCFDVCTLPASLDVGVMPLYWVRVRSPQLYECVRLAGSRQVVFGFVGVSGGLVVGGGLLLLTPVV